MCKKNMNKTLKEDVIYIFVLGKKERKHTSFIIA